MSNKIVKNVVQYLNSKAIVAAIVGVVLVVGVTIAIVSSGGGEEADHSHALATFEDWQGNTRGLVMNMNGGPMTQASLEKPENVYMGKYTCSLKWKNKIYFIGYRFRIVFCITKF